MEKKAAGMVLYYLKMKQCGNSYAVKYEMCMYWCGSY